MYTTELIEVVELPGHHMGPHGLYRVGIHGVPGEDAQPFMGVLVKALGDVRRWGSIRHTITP